MRTRSLLLVLTLCLLAGSRAIAGEARVVRQASNGTATLLPEDAQIVGKKLTVEGNSVRRLCHWVERSDYPKWTLRLDKPGTYTLKLVYACQNDTAGARFKVDIGPASVNGQVQRTGSWDDYRTTTLAKVQVTAAGSLSVCVRVTEMPGRAVMDLRQIRLDPAD